MKLNYHFVQSDKTIEKTNKGLPCFLVTTINDKIYHLKECMCGNALTPIVSSLPCNLERNQVG